MNAEWDNWDNDSNDWYNDGGDLKRYDTATASYNTWAGETSWTDYDVYATLKNPYNVGIYYRCSSPGNCLFAGMSPGANYNYFSSYVNGGSTNGDFNQVTWTNGSPSTGTY